MIKGAGWGTAAPWPSASRQQPAGRKQQKKYSALNWPWQLCLFKRKKKHLPDETQQESTENKVGRVVLSHIQIRVAPKQKTQQKEEGGRRGVTETKQSANMSESPSCGDAFTVGKMLPPSHRGAIRDTVALKRNGAADGFNGTKCAKVQLHLRWWTDLSRKKSPKSGLFFALRANGPSLAQTDLISVWFTTINHLMSPRRHQIVHSFIFLSLGYNKSAMEKKKGKRILVQGLLFFSHHLLYFQFITGQ